MGGVWVVLREWEAMHTYHARKNAHKHKKSFPTSESAVDLASSDNESTTSATPRSRHDSSSSLKKPAAPVADSGSFSSLKSKIHGAPPASGPVAEEAEQGDHTDERANETAEAMAGPRNREGDKGVGEVGEVDELVLVCHGIGQKLAGAYESFNFVHAVNQLRSYVELTHSPSLLSRRLASPRLPDDHDQPAQLVTPHPPSPASVLAFTQMY